MGHKFIGKILKHRGSWLATCPRCGGLISWLERRKVGSQTYVYAVHYKGYDVVEGKIRKRVKRCYLGPEDRYRYVTMLHIKEGLILKGLVEDKRWFEYLEAILEFLYSDKHNLGKGEILQIAELLEKYAEKLRARYKGKKD